MGGANMPDLTDFKLPEEHDDEHDHECHDPHCDCHHDH